VSDDGPSSRPDSAACHAAVITVEAVDPAWLAALPECPGLCHEATLAVLAKLGFDAFGDALEVGVRLSGDGELRALNQQYRHMDKATNVLSFAASDCFAGALPAAPPAGAPLALGDVVLGLETVCAEAADQGKAVADHMRHLVVHGVLHLVGYDHEDDDQASVMETLETDILAGLGIADPYGVEPRAVAQGGARS